MLIVLGLQIYASEDYTCPEQQQKRIEKWKSLIYVSHFKHQRHHS